jgi:hypothetical protein
MYPDSPQIGKAAIAPDSHFSPEKALFSNRLKAYPQILWGQIE